MGHHFQADTQNIPNPGATLLVNRFLVCPGARCTRGHADGPVQQGTALYPMDPKWYGFPVSMLFISHDYFYAPLHSWIIQRLTSSPPPCRVKEEVYQMLRDRKDES
jgi:hypothetical protein